MKEDWFKVENLMKSQNERMKEYDEGNVKNQNDFDSYRLLYEGKENSSGIANHNSRGYSARTVALSIKKWLPIAPKSIADLGGRIYC